MIVKTIVKTINNVSIVITRDRITASDGWYARRKEVREALESSDSICVYNDVPRRPRLKVPVRAKNENGFVTLGCCTFTKTGSKKILKWAGVK